MKKISFVIPCYGSENTIESVVDEIKAIIATKEVNYEIILVNDNSPDNVWQIIEKLTLHEPNVKGVRFTKNFGQHAALIAGYRKSSGDIIVSLDDDGQTPANEVFCLIDKLSEGYDVVYGTYKKRKDNFFRKLGTYVNRKMAEIIIGKPKNIEFTSYFIMRKNIVDEIIRYKGPFTYIAGLIFRTTNNIANVTVNHRTRNDGKSGYTLKKLLSLWLNGFTAFSVKPLRIATVTGGILSLVGVISILFVIINKLLNPSIAAGYSSTMAALIFIGGIIMCMLGLIGEYIGRIYISINNSPQYVIKEKINID